MHDPEFDGDYPKKPSAETLVSRPASWPKRLQLIRFIPQWPIPRLAQAVFAESFRQALVEGLTVDQSIRLAADVNPSRRLGPVLRKTAAHVRAGYPIEAALEKTRAKVLPGLMAALRVGEENGCLAEEMSTFARRTCKLTTSRYFRAIGRSSESIDFAAALGRLLRDQHLTVRAVRDAGEVTAGGRPRFSNVVEDIVRDMENGRSLAESLSRHPAYFDMLYRGFLGAATSREEMRSCLDRLGTFP